MSTPGNFTKGRTDSLIEICFGIISWVKSSSLRVLPAITLAANLAKGTPIALETKGAVREARGLTSKI